MKVAIVVYPGSNADWEALHAIRDVVGAEAQLVSYRAWDLGAADAVVLPGGFSYGDYLRPGAIARFSPISQALVEFAASGRPMLGICNGFQILTELGLLPGALLPNAHQRFECRDVWVSVGGGGAFTESIPQGTVLRLPIAHEEGRYTVDPETLAALEADERIALRYCTADGDPVAETPTNPNGSVANIAGVYNEARNVLGLMPHPERAAEALVGNDEGLRLLSSLGAELKAAS